MVAVSNTSPLSNLAIIGRLGLLQEQFGTVLVPTAVRQELSRLRHSVAIGSLDAAFSEGWLRIPQLQHPANVAIGVGLHPGETAALGLAVDQNADIVLLDDGDARRRAAEIGLRFTGVLGVLLRARQAGGIPSFREEIRRLREEAHFFIAAKLELELLIAAGES